MSAINQIKDEQARAFAGACYDDNSPNELRDALANGADETDMKTWGIDEEQWIEAVNSALIDLNEDQGDAYMLHEIGQSLFGTSWQSDMARALGMSDARRVRYWAAGERDIPPGVWRDLIEIMRQRAGHIISIRDALIRGLEEQ